MDKKALHQKFFRLASYWPPDFKAVTSLLDQSADINFILEGESIITTLLQDHDNPYLATMLRFLLEHGADPNLNINAGFNCLYDACLINRPDIVSILLEAGVNCNCICTETGESLWDWAIGEQFFLRTIVLPEHEKHEKNHDTIVELLKSYKAKSSLDL